MWVCVLAHLRKLVLVGFQYQVLDPSLGAGVGRHFHHLHSVQHRCAGHNVELGDPIHREQLAELGPVLTAVPAVVLHLVQKQPQLHPRDQEI